MSGIYIHIPFCKQACYYCDFHFSTSTKKKEEMLEALRRELQLRKKEFESEIVETIYFGGGTPSILTTIEINQLIDEIYQNYTIAKHPEITLEANPDDLSSEKIKKLATTRINRLSIGVQSFFEEDLKMMNRAHNADEAKKCLKEATAYFDNISVDLIYGIPGMTNERWLQNIETLLSFEIPHISSYALTVEPKTTLYKLIQKGTIKSPNDELAREHFLILVDFLQSKNFIHYELSNFGKENYFSRNNSAYWLGKKYLGIGPSAHSYNGIIRSWNIANNTLYTRSIQEGKLPNEQEVLSVTDRYNEYIMTGLRTIWGVSLEKVETEFGQNYLEHLQLQIHKFLENGLLFLEKDILTVTKKGKFVCDGIASDLFIINL